MTITNNDMESRLEQARVLMSAIAELPTVPAIVLRIAGKLNDPDVAVDEIVDLVFQDQVLTARVVRHVNSAYYSPAKQITSLKEAVVYLGLEALREAVFTCAVVDLFATGKGVFSRAVLWGHALAVARVSRLIAELTGYRDPSTVYIAGLLHDIGEVFLNFYRGEDFKKVLQLVEFENATFYEAESRMFGISHAEIGFEFGTRSHLTDYVNDAILYHHNLNGAPSDHAGVVAIVSLADTFCTMYQLGYEGSPATMAGSDDLSRHPAWDLLAASAECGDFDQSQVMTELFGYLAKVRSGVDDIFPV